MKNFQEIAEKIINKTISGDLILRNGNKINSRYLKRHDSKKYPYLIDEIGYTVDGMYFEEDFSYHYDVIDFIPDTKYLNHIESAVSLLNCVFVPPQYFKNENGIIYKLVGKEENLYVFENMHNSNIVYKTAYQATKLISTDSILENVLNHMERKSIVIDIPDGMCIDESKSTFEKIVFKKKDTKPRSWEEYVKQSKGTDHYALSSDFYTGYCSKSNIYGDEHCIVPTKELAEAFLAMMQLMSLRQAWIGDWKPDVKAHMYGIVHAEEGIRRQCIGVYVPLSFPTKEMTDDFMNCFKDLLKIAEPLI